MMELNGILQEITPLGEHDFMYIADRQKSCFDYPLHRHNVYELNFVENARGCQRIVGDNTETIGDYDLVLITSPDLEHVWMQGECTSADIHEITIQFYVDFSQGVFSTNPFESISKMVARAQNGLAFPMPAIMKVYSRLIGLKQIKERFYLMHELFAILYELSKCDGARELSSSAFAKVEADSDSRRVLKVKSYISEHYVDDIRLEQMSEMVGMTPSGFSRFFKLSTGKSLAEYIVDIRLGHAARKLVDTAMSISEICYDCGFNTLSNFNRLFRKRKGCSPKEFREKYIKTKVMA